MNQEHSPIIPFLGQDPYLSARELDPLNMDETLLILPSLNSTKDVGKIILATEASLDQLPDELNEEESIAALRDFDFLVSSLIRHGVEPVDSVHGLNEGLQHIAAITHTVPRGSVSTYTTANPIDERMRTFTGTAEEKVFITEVTNSARALDTAMYSFGTDGYATGLHNTSQALDTMIRSILIVKKEVSPEFFTNNLRPYFDAMTVNGQRYLGSGGAQLQLVGIDFLLWGVNDPNQTYQAFFNENFAYMTPRQRESVSKALAKHDGMSIVDHLSTFRDPQMAEDAISTLRKIRKFRFPHRKIAVDNFKLRSKDAVGSGSYTPEILNLLIDKNDAALTRLEALYGE